MKTVVFAFLAFSMAGFAEDLPLAGISHVALRVSDIDQARGFFNSALGFDEAFDFKNEQGGLAMAFFKINDDQYLEVFPGIRETDKVLLVHIGIRTSNIERLHQLSEERGLKPGKIATGPRDHDRHFIIHNLPGQVGTFLEFMEYGPESIYKEYIGKALSSRRISTHLEHAGIVTTDVEAARSFYVDKMNFTETWRRNNDDGSVLLMHLRMPGPTRDYLELCVRKSTAELTRKQTGSPAHFSLEVPDIKTAFQTATERGLTKGLPEPRFGRDDRWQFNMFAPDGTRVECMQPKAAK